MRRTVSGLLVWTVAMWGVAALAERPEADGAQQKPPARTDATKRGAGMSARDARGDANHPGHNPNHPLKDSSTDPGPGPEKGMPDPRTSDGATTIMDAGGDWPWGELFYGKTYPTKLTITNECWSDETVGIFVSGLPYVTLPSSVTVPAKGKKDVPINIVTPPAPKLLLTGHEDLPKHGIFDTVEGEIVVWHPWRFDPECKPKRESYTATGHIHYDIPPPPPPPPSPEKIGGADPCQVWWNTGERPRQVETEDQCTDRIRQLASEYRSRVLQSLVDRAPAQWAWLPSVEQIAQMPIGELLEMKAKVRIQLEKER